MIDESWLAANLPVLGEPVPIELANTRYRDRDEVIEFLASPTMATTWFACSPTATALTGPDTWTTDAWRRLVELRDVVDDLLRIHIARQQPQGAIVGHLNRTARRLITWVELQWDEPGVVRAVEHHSAGDRADVTLGRIALETIALLAGPDADLLRVCANDDCEMLFLKHHHRRRWCHESCGHRHRQAAYYRTHKRSSGRR
jgi:predicted RNA-binding Zn ribbon-like protein